MLYSIVPLAFFIINIILNYKLFLSYGFISKKQKDEDNVHVRYNWFLLTSNIYLLIDMSWGLLYEHHERPALFPFIYILTVFYFIFMLLTMVSWTRYIVAYLYNKGLKSSILVHTVWALFTIGLLCLIANRFYHFMFYYTEEHVYVGLNGRNISFLLQIAFYTIITTYMFVLAHKTIGRQKIRYQAVAATSMVLCIFLTLQILFAFYPFYAMGLTIGISLVHSFVEMDEKKEKDIHDHIASSMAEDYEAIFYIDIASGEYLSFSKSQKYMSMKAKANGKDFFKDALESIENCVYPDDWEYAKSFYNKETMLKNLEGKKSFSFKYRVLIDNKPRFFLFTVMRESSGKYFIFYEKDIEDELIAEKKQKENQKKTITFSQIAESLASNYDVIYYVDIKDSSYVCYQANEIFGELQVNNSGDNFFEESVKNIPSIIHAQDCDQIIEFINRDNMISTMESHKDCSINYRIMVSGKAQYTRMTIRKSSDGSHFIICVENIDEEVNREKQHLKELKTEKELARRDELTGVKNKTAYNELVASVQGNIDKRLDYLNFALIVCDTNNLKQINDSQGHAAGDEYLIAAAKMVCNIFVHSPVFRIGGDEFVVFLCGDDYSVRYELLNKMNKLVLENNKNKKGVILASGMAEYDPEKDTLVSDIFERADKEMYENKKNLKKK